MGNYDSDYDPENEIGTYDPDEDLEMMFDDEDLAELRSNI